MKKQRTWIWTAFVFVGLASVFHGLWLFDPRAAFVVVGAVLAALGLFGARGVHVARERERAERFAREMRRPS